MPFMKIECSIKKKYRNIVSIHIQKMLKNIIFAVILIMIISLNFCVDKTSEVQESVILYANALFQKKLI